MANQGNLTENMSIPPFFIGQSIVALYDLVCGMKKGETTNVVDIQKCRCGKWFVDYGKRTPYHISELYSECSCGLKRAVDKNAYLAEHTFFAPAKQLKFPLISLSQIVKKEQQQVLAAN